MNDVEIGINYTLRNLPGVRPGAAREAALVILRFVEIYGEDSCG